jgi:hypothetical protein
MINRIIWVGRNDRMPVLRDLVICPVCDGDGYDYGYGNNPSEKPFKVVCNRCNGQGAYERPVNNIPRAAPSPARTLASPMETAPLFDATADRWVRPPSGVKPDAAAGGTRLQSKRISQEPRAQSPLQGRGAHMGQIALLLAGSCTAIAFLAAVML